MRQKLALEAIVANGGNVSSAMRQAGYSEAMVRNSQRLTRSEGFLQLAEECGLTDTFLTKALVSDIKAKRRNRKPELELGYKVLGRLRDKDENPLGNVYNFNFFNEDQLRKIASRAIDGNSTGTEEPY